MYLFCCDASPFKPYQLPRQLIQAKYDEKSSNKIGIQKLPHTDVYVSYLDSILHICTRAGDQRLKFQDCNDQFPPFERDLTNLDMPRQHNLLSLPRG